MFSNSFSVSVVITSYNQKEYLIEAIESVLNQTLMPLEIIIVDDCSSDGSQEVIKVIAEKHPKLIKAYYHKRNLGIPKNRNFGLERVRGDYVSILDGDDMFLPFKIERETEVLEKNPEINIVYSNFYVINKNEKKRRLRYSDPLPSGNIFKDVFAIMFGQLRTALISYSTLKKVGFMDSNFPNFDGFELMIRLSSKYLFQYIPEPLLKKRVHQENFQKKIMSEISLTEFLGIFEKNKHLLNELSPKEVLYIKRLYLANMSLLEARILMEKGRRNQALKKYIAYLRETPSGIKNYKYTLKFILPRSLYNNLKEKRRFIIFKDGYMGRR